MGIRPGMVLCLLLFWSPLRSSGETEQTILEEARHGNRAAVQSIRSFSCRFSVKNLDGAETETGEYWRSGETVRIRQTLLDPSRRIRASNLWLLESQRVYAEEGHVGGDSRQLRGTITARLDQTADNVWGYALITFLGPNYDRWTFDELLTKPCRVRSAKRVSEESREYIYVDLTHQAARLEFWFDPSANYMIRKLVIHADAPEGSKDKKRTWDSVVSSFKEVAPTVFFPESVTAQAFADKKRIQGAERTFTDVHVNRPISVDVFSVRYSPGMEISDTIQGKVFTAGADGRLTQVPGKELAREMPLARASLDQHQSTAEPVAVSRWILPVSVAILVAAGAGWLVRRKRRSVMID